MFLKRISIFLFLIGQGVLGQDAISGYINFEEPVHWESHVYLSQILLNDFDGSNRIEPIAIADIRKDGFFKFDRKYFSEQDKIYQLHVERIQNIINDTITKKVTFISSNRDSLRFPKGNQIFSSYFTTNHGDKEWMRLKTFETQLLEQYHSKNEAEHPAKRFVKDSLQILMVKLIGIKELQRKNLLDKDIVEHPEFYLELLSELKESNIDPNEYLFLDRKLAYLTKGKVERKLKRSLALNIVLGFALVGMVFLVVKWGIPKKQLSVPSLSRQEATIKKLILQGKTNKEIANELFISLSTVKTHITNLYAKLNVSSRAELLQKSTGTST